MKTKKNNIYLWIIIGGPIVVIIACIATIYIAVKNPNIVIEGYQNDGSDRQVDIKTEIKK
tara:strand:+ start:608 stop:787 length:180 start_codon:yes stop_codon:yes gene_type:complete